MNRTGIEKALYSAVNNAPQLPFEQLAAMPYVKMQEHDYITKQAEVKSAGHIRQYSYAAAFCLTLLVLLSGWYFTNRVSSVITLDVNPSIEIRTNLSDRVLSVRAINEDAEAILGDNDYKGKKLAEAVPLLMNTLVEHQYLNTEHNAILLTVTNRSNKKADVLRSTIDTAIRKSLLSYNIAPTILSQKLSKETERAKLAEQYGLSEGKLSLIQDLIADNPSFTIDSLAGKSVSQLYNLAKENTVDLNKYFINEEDRSSYINPGKTGTKDDAEKTPVPGESDIQGSSDTGESDIQGSSDTEESDIQGSSDTEGNDTETENEIGSSNENEGQDIENQDQQGNNEDNEKENEGEDNHSSKSGDSGKKDKSKDSAVPAGNINNGSGKEDNQDNEDTQISGQEDDGSREDSQVSENSGEDGVGLEDESSGTLQESEDSAETGDLMEGTGSGDSQESKDIIESGDGTDAADTEVSPDEYNNENQDNTEEVNDISSNTSDLIDSTNTSGIEDQEEDNNTLAEQDNQNDSGDYQESSDTEDGSSKNESDD